MSKPKAYRILHKVNKDTFVEVTVKVIKVDSKKYEKYDSDELDDVVGIDKVHEDVVTNSYRYFYDCDYDQHKEKFIKFKNLNLAVLVKPDVKECTDNDQDGGSY